MSFDLSALERAVRRHGRLCRVVIARTRGSVPRETGAAMLVWADGQSGTIGGGTLEYRAAERARASLERGDWVEKVPLGPALGQCCGGAVTLLGEVFDARRLGGISGPAFVRRVTGDRPMPLALRDQLRRARNAGTPVSARLLDGWMIEPIAPPRRRLWLHGAGHVGRAVVSVLSPCPEFEITWIDTARDRFPGDLPEGVDMLFSPTPADLVRVAPPDAEHLVFTHSHALDLEICHRLLTHGFRSAGLIGSATKWARFRSQLAGLGHPPEAISRITCPIGQPALGKHPQAIAIGVASALLSRAGQWDKTSRPPTEQQTGRHHERSTSGG